jgi:hypothetical protein
MNFIKESTSYLPELSAAYKTNRLLDIKNEALSSSPNKSAAPMEKSFL